MNPIAELETFENETARFDSLMSFKIQNILLVSSLYDIYNLREDGQLTDLLLAEYAEFRLSSAPAIKRVDSGTSALKALEESKFELIIVLRTLTDIKPAEFSKKARKLCPGIPVVLMAIHHRELEQDREEVASACDNVFIWNGDSKMLLTIIKLVEDRVNVAADTDQVGVRVIILVENSVRFYSSYLPLMYTEIMQQASALLRESINSSTRRVRMRARPKILLAENFEDAVSLFHQYRKYLLGVISDIRFPKKGVSDPAAGIELARLMKSELADLPILLQSSDQAMEEQALAGETAFLNKQSPQLLKKLGTFINENFGFGDFVFKLPDGTELARASSFRQMQECIASVDHESLVFHAERNHFSNWLIARGEFDLANCLRPRKASEFVDPADLRGFLVETINRHRHDRQAGMVTDFDRELYDGHARFLRISQGSLGGKGRGLAFINKLFNNQLVCSAFPGARISVPPTAVICTGAFDQFMEKNDLTEFALEQRSDEDIIAAFTNATIPNELQEDLKAFLGVVDYPLAVRSSSLLEDNYYQPFAGIFDTHFLPNNQASSEGRLQRLLASIKLIYASVYLRNAKNYTQSTGNRTEEEKMAVILQKIVGEEHDGFYYPVFSGVARSYNFYSVGHIKPEEGIAYTALGLGKTIMEGDNCLYFSPANPQVLPQFSTSQDYLENSQRKFIAVDMTNSSVFPEVGGEGGLATLNIKEAEGHGVLKYVGSTYSADNDRIYTGIARKGPRVVTFDPILKANIFPLGEILKHLLELGSRAMNVPVEIEFAAEIDIESTVPNKFRLLQIRPMKVAHSFEDVSLYDQDDSRVVCRSDQALSNGRINDIQDIVFVRNDNFKRRNMVHMADQVEKYNRKFRNEDIPYMLIGPGRWGTTDRWLGVPTKWNQISSARVIVEADYGDFVVEPSFGTHFFQNLITFSIAYLTINSSSSYSYFNWDWLNSIEPVSETEYLRHVRLDEPLEVLVDGRIGRAIVLR
ncbi:MAG: histidine kinase [Xanthomonadales bacterium]|nr:histidine kinase [Gammaproteobacteria bacterium]MBT8055040.1 histidine kinase [Gammaproteobacteria bacterium]NND57037.1 histidine kinase [Xanthomonadales bacterium]